jgi:hypothetical protein
MGTRFKPALSLGTLFLIITLILSNFEVSSQGRFLRGVEKVEFTLKGTEADFFVSLSGNDTWSGKLAEPNKNGTDGPFATIERAREAVREIKEDVYVPKKPTHDKRFIGTPHKVGPGRDILVLIREGTYSLENPLEFSPEDGGERVETDLPTGAFEYHELKDYFVTYAAYPGESPVITGGERITGWVKGRNGIWKAGIRDTEINELFVNGTRMILARSPNTGYYQTDGQPADSSCFIFKKGDIKPWKDLHESRLHIVVRWSSINTGIERIDMKNRKLYLKDVSPDIMIIPPKYYIENNEELLDTTGEWYLSRRDKTVSLIPDEEITDMNMASVIYAKLETLIRVAGTREIPVRNLMLSVQTLRIIMFQTSVAMV